MSEPEETRKAMEMYESMKQYIRDQLDNRTVQVRLGDLRRWFDRAAWTPQMLDTLDAEEYGRTMMAQVSLQQAIVRELRRAEDEERSASE